VEKKVTSTKETKHDFYKDISTQNSILNLSNTER